MTQSVSINSVDPNPFQTRALRDEAADESLKKSIEESGLLQAILIRPHPTISGRYQLVFGHRRLRACKALGWKTIPGEIRELSDKQVAEITLHENLEREDLNPVEEAQGFKLLIDEYDYTELEIAQKYCKSRPFVSNRLRLLCMDPYLIKCVLSEVLQPGQALMISTVPGILPYRLADLTVDWSFTFEETRVAVKQVKAGEDVRFTRRVKVSGLRVLEPRFFDCDSSLLEEMMSGGVQPFPISVNIDCSVRLGHLMVIAAKKLGWKHLDAEIVFPIEYLTEACTTPVEQCRDPTQYSVGMFPDRTESQKIVSAKLNYLIRGQEHKYPILVIDPPNEPDDLNSLPIAKPVRILRAKLVKIIPATPTVE